MEVAEPPTQPRPLRAEGRRPRFGGSSEISAAGVHVDTIPHTPGAGQQAFLHDPAGNVIELNQPD